MGTSFEHAYRRAVAEQQVVRVEDYYAPFDRWLQVTIYPSAEGLTVVAQDMTDRVRIQQVSARLAAIVDSSEDAIIGKRLDGTITSWNQAAERIFGYSAAEMVGQSIYRLIPPELHGAETDVLQRVTRGEPVEFAEVERIRKDGQRIYHRPHRLSHPGQLGQGGGGLVHQARRHRPAEYPVRARRRKRPEPGAGPGAGFVPGPGAESGRPDHLVEQRLGPALRLVGLGSAGPGLSRAAADRVSRPAGRDPRRAWRRAGRWEGELIHVAKDGHRVHVASQWMLRRGRGDGTAFGHRGQHRRHRRSGWCRSGPARATGWSWWASSPAAWPTRPTTR